MTVIVYLLSVIWCIRLVANLVSYVHLWFVKEYRFDRMIIHLKTKQGKGLLFLPWRRPPASPKSITICVGTAAVEVILFTLLPFFIFWKLLILDILLFPVTALFVFLTKIPTLIYHKRLIIKAVQKLQAHKPMTVVGITGSFGKTSTKEFLASILGHKYKTLKTRASQNSPIAIAETILSQLKPEHEVFVVEMGAYKSGEIAKMCGMVHPQIGIVTAINEQHQDLFGTIEGTVSAKYELIR
jgi:UDP-N-acetylmuramoyl-tripeptide--D-alanyl-D-alanine ligase